MLIYLVVAAVSIVGALIADSYWFRIPLILVTLGSTGELTTYVHRLIANRPISEGIRRRTEKAVKSLKLDSQAVYLDTETTGLGDIDEVIEIAVLSDQGVPLLNTLVRPTSRVSITRASRKVHGIRKGDLRKAPTWEDIYGELARILEGKVIRAWNSDFDERLLRQTCRAWDLPELENEFVCVMKAFGQHHGTFSAGRKKGYKWWKLEDALAIYPECFVDGKTHRAMTDCRHAFNLVGAITDCSEASLQGP